MTESQMEGILRLYQKSFEKKLYRIMNNKFKLHTFDTEMEQIKHQYKLNICIFSQKVFSLTRKKGNNKLKYRKTRNIGQ